MSGRTVVLGVDVGSGGCKVTCLDRDGQVRSTAYRAYPNDYPHPRWVEQDPRLWVSAAFDACVEALSRASSGGRPTLVGLAFSGPHHIGVLLDDHGDPVRPAIMLSDQRSGLQSAMLARTAGEHIRARTANLPTPTWTLCHLAWLREHEPAALGATRRLVFMKDYVRFAFTGRWGTDHIDAGGSLLFDIHQREWDPDLVRLAGLEPEQLPPTSRPTDVCGELTPAAARALRVASRIPVVTGTADTAAEALGSGLLEVGDASVKLATAGNTCVVTDRIGASARPLTYEYLLAGTFYRNTATNAAASAFRWFAETFARAGELEGDNGADRGRHYAELDDEASRVPPGSGGMIFHPYLMGERSPLWDPKLRAAFLGVTAASGRGHFARAVMEGVAMSVRDAARDHDDRLGGTMRLIGGGSNSRVWAQILADVLGRELIVPRHRDASFGTALLAAHGIGWYASLAEAVAACQGVERTVSPEPHGVATYDALFEVYRAAIAPIAVLSQRLGDLSEGAGEGGAHA